MNYFVDFEANAHTKEIISIGIKDSAGHSFYSLVRPTTRLDHKIIELTGIAQEQAEVAPTIDEVAVALGAWLDEHTDNSAVFYNYGSTDKDFVKASMAVAETEYAQSLLDFILHRLHNIAPEVARRFNRSAIALRSVYLTMRMETEDSLPEAHDALNDAEMLEYVFNRYQTYVLPEGVTPVKVTRKNLSYGKVRNLDPKYQVAIHVTSDTKKHGHREWDFKNVGAAMSIIPRLSKNTNKTKVMDKILEAARTNGSYAGKNFSLAE